jgi:hypothetical protein
MAGRQHPRPPDLARDTHGVRSSHAVPAPAFRALPATTFTDPGSTRGPGRTQSPSRRDDGVIRTIPLSPKTSCVKPQAGIAAGGLPSSAARSVLRTALWVTVAPAIRWVAVRSGRGPDGSGMVTVMCCCSAVSWGVPVCRQAPEEGKERGRGCASRGGGCGRGRGQRRTGQPPTGSSASRSGPGWRVRCAAACCMPSETRRRCACRCAATGACPPSAAIASRCG